MKKVSVLLSAVVVAVSFSFVAKAETKIQAQVDNSVNDGYVPTQLANGDFEHYPDGGETSPTGGSDWQTTETQAQGNMGVTGYFERIVGGHVNMEKNYSIRIYNGDFVEMNSKNPSVLYQNLATNPGDVILWKLSHATRNGGAPEIQEMEVHIGKNDSMNQPVGVDSNITENLAIYKFDGITNSGDVEYGYLAGGLEDLAALRLTKVVDWRNDPDPWKVAKAVYRIPEEQTSTRFAFKSDIPNSTSGNFLDDVIFTTLLGNVKVDNTLADGIRITGYWSSVEENDDIDISYVIKSANDGDIQIDGSVDMSALRTAGDTGFSIMIPYGDMEDGDYVLEVSHENYKEAKITTAFSVKDTPKTLQKIEAEKQAVLEEEVESQGSFLDNNTIADVVNPNTSDNIAVWVMVGALSSSGLLGVLLCGKREA